MTTKIDYKKIQNEAAIEFHKNPSKENSEKVRASFDRLINWVANYKFKKLKSGSSIQKDDILQECWLGLFSAFRLYDGESDFTKYVTCYILGYSQNAISRSMSLINFGRDNNRQSLLSSYSKLYKNFDDGVRSINEIHNLISKSLGVTLADVDSFFIQKTQIKSLDSKVSSESKSDIHSLIADDNADFENTVIDIIDFENLKNTISSQITNNPGLTKKSIYEYVLRERIFSDCDNNSEIAKKLNVSRERVRLIHKKLCGMLNKTVGKDLFKNEICKNRESMVRRMQKAC